MQMTIPQKGMATGIVIDIASGKAIFIFQGHSSYFFLIFAHLWWFGGLGFWVGVFVLDFEGGDFSW